MYGGTYEAEITKDIMHANHLVSIWWSFKGSGMVPFRVRCSPVLSGLSQFCHWSPGFVPVQWRVNVGQADLRDGGGGRAFRRFWLDITRQSRAADWWGLQRCTMGWGSLLLSPVLPCLQPKPAEQLVKYQKYPSDQKKKTWTLLCYHLNFWQVIINQKSTVNSSISTLLLAFNRRGYLSTPRR